MAKKRSSSVVIGTSADSSVQQEFLKQDNPDEEMTQSTRRSGNKKTSTTRSSRIKYHSNSMPMAHLDFMNGFRSTPQSENNILDPPKAKRRNSYMYVSESSRGKKSVRFATNVKTDQVWCTMREYEPEPQERRHELWTTSQEQYNRYERDMDLVDDIGNAYFETLLPAYDKCNERSGEVDMDFEEWRENEALRGLEGEVMQSDLSDYVKRHRRAVLKAQVLILQAQEAQEEDEQHCCNDESSFNERCISRWNALRRVSTKHSQRLQLIAQKMAKFDQRSLSPPRNRWS